MSARRFAFAGGVSLLAMLSTAPAMAQAAEDSSDGGVAEIVVTAQKRTQNLQDVAGSISAIGAAQLELTGTKSVQDLAAQTPSLIWGQTNGGSFVTLRGVGLSVDTGVAEPNVALHVDGVFIPRSTMATLDGEDLERVEVLRGPQGTLYGRNATGGAINMISKAPSSAMTAGFNFGYGNYDTVRANGFVSGPISDRTRFRMSAAYEDRGEGYAQNLFTGQSYDKLRQYTFRGALQSDLSDRLVADLSVLYQHTDFQTYQQLIYPVGPVGFLVFPPFAGAVAPSAPRTIGNDYNPDSNRSTFMVRGALTLDVSDNVQLKSITGYINAKFHNSLDGDGTNRSFINVVDRNQPSESVSQEFNLGGKGLGGKLDWLVGAYYFHENFRSDIPVPFPSGLGNVLPVGTVLVNSLSEKTRSLAVFSDLTYSVAPRLRVYAGARYSNDVKKALVTNGALIPGVPAAFTLACVNEATRQEYNSFSPRIGLQVDLANHVMGYGQYQKGFKSGGVNSASCGNTYKPEKLDAFEVGIKSTFLDRHVVLNISGFHYKYNGLQVFQYFPPSSSRIDNADARVWGAEIESQIQFNKIASLSIGATFLDAEYTRFLSQDPADFSGAVLDRRGNRLDRAPKYAITVSPQLDIPVSMGSFDHLVLRGDIRFSGDYFFRPYNLEGDRQKPYQMVNLSASLGGADGLQVRAFVKNLTKVDVISHKFYNSPHDTWLGNYLPPRTYGIEFGYRF